MKKEEKEVEVKVEEEPKEEVKEEPVVEKKEPKPQSGKNFVIILLSIVILVLLFLIIDIKFIAKENKEDKTTTEEKSKDKEEKKDDKKDTDEKKEETNTKEETKYEDVSLENSLVTEAYSLVPRGICGHLYFREEKMDLKLSKLTSEDKMKMIENHYRRQIPGPTKEGKLYISDAELKRYFEDTSFAKDYVENTPENKRRIGLADEILYEDGKLSLRHLYGTGCEGPSQGTMVALYSAKKAENKLALNVVVYTQKPVRDEMGDDGYYHFVYEIYRDSDMKEKGYEGYFEGLTSAKDNLDPNFFYGYQFVFDTTDGNLRVQEVNYLDHLSEGL